MAWLTSRRGKDPNALNGPCDAGVSWHAALQWASCSLGILFVVFACGKLAPNRVLVLQDSPQEWADALKLGFEAGLGEAGFTQGATVTVVNKSAAGERRSLVTLAEFAATGDYKAVFTLGTQASQEYFRAMIPEKSPPMVFGAVTDPVKAGFYAGDITKPAKNLTGSQDVWPYEAQFHLIRTLLPNARKVGVLLNPAEANTQAGMRFVRDAARATGFELVEKPTATAEVIPIATGALIASGVDAIYIGPDNLTQGNHAAIIGLADSARIPVFTGISGIVKDGAVGTVGTNYIEVGRVNGRQVAKILQGVRAVDIPPAISTDGDLYLNLPKCEELGIAVPPELSARAVPLSQ